GLHLTLSGERILRIVRKRLNPTAKLRLMHTQVLPGLRIRYAAILDQPHSLKLEFAGKLPSLHDPPPAPSKHLTRCLRNRVQASRRLWKLQCGTWSRQGKSEEFPVRCSNFSPQKIDCNHGNQASWYLV